MQQLAREGGNRVGTADVKLDKATELPSEPPHSSQNQT